MTEIILLRHGKSDWREEIEDFHRPLRKRGRIAAQRAGVWLKENQRLPDQVISSPAERAVATARLCVGSAGINAGCINLSADLYLTDHVKMAEVINQYLLANRRTLIVAHNPGMDGLLCYLSKHPINPDADGKLMSTGALALLSLAPQEEKLQQGCASLITRLRPQQLVLNGEK